MINFRLNPKSLNGLDFKIEFFQDLVLINGIPA